jgi:hypothetical protein
MALGKNYYRDDLSHLFCEDLKQIISTGRYKHTDSCDWVTLTTIRPYNFGNKKNKSVCNHINLKKCEVDKYLQLDEDVHNRKIYFYATIYNYDYYGDTRSGLRLVQTLNISPIWVTFIGKYRNMLQAERVLNDLKTD